MTNPRFVLSVCCSVWRRGSSGSAVQPRARGPGAGAWKAGEARLRGQDQRGARWTAAGSARHHLAQRGWHADQLQGRQLSVRIEYIYDFFCTRENCEGNIVVNIIMEVVN